MKLKTLFILLLLSLSSLAHAETVDKIIAVVNDEPITLYQLDKLMAEKLDELKAEEKKEVQKEKFENFRDLALKKLIGEALLEKEMSKYNIKVEDKDVDKALANITQRNGLTREQLQAQIQKKGNSYDQYLADLKVQLRKLKFIGEVIAPRVKVTDADLDAFFAEHPDQFGAYQSVKMAQIIFPLSDTASEAEVDATLSKAKEAAKKARGKTDFAELGKKYSQNYQSAVPAIYQVNQLSLELGQAISTLKPGEVSEPLRTSLGFQVVKLYERKTLAGEEYQAVREQLRERVFEQKIDEKLEEFVEELKSKSYVEIKSS